MRHMTYLEVGAGAGRHSTDQGLPILEESDQVEFRVTLDPFDYQLYGNALPLPPNLWVLDRLTYRWAMSGYPAQPEPVVCSFRLLAADPETLPPLEVGTLVYARTTGTGDTFDSPEWSSAETVTAGAFFGRISDSVVRAVVFRGQAMLEVEVTAVDHTAEWREITVGAQPFPMESDSDRITRIIELGGMVAGSNWTGIGAGVTFRGIDVDSRPWLDLLDEHLAQMTRLEVFGSSAVKGWTRGIPMPQIAGAGDDAPPGEVMVAVTPLDQRGGTGPRVLAEVDGLLVSMAADTVGAALPNPQGLQGASTVSARYCAATLEWRRDKADLPNRVVVSGDFEPLAGVPGGSTVVASHEDLVATQGQVTRRLDSTLRYAVSAQDMAEMYLPDRAEYVGRWATETVTVYVGAIAGYQEARALLEAPPLFPWHGVYSFYNNADGHPFGATFHVHGLQVGHRLGGASYVAGTILGAALTVQANAPDHERLLLEVSLAPQVRRPAYTDSPNAADYTGQPAMPLTLKWHHPTVTVRDAGAGAPYLDPTVTVYDLRLVRNEEGTP